MQRKIRVLVGKPGLDGHDRGAKVVAAALRDAGMEVIYTGLHQAPEQIVEAALQEDVDVVALSILSGAHMTLFPVVLALMKERGLGDRLLTGGGIIPPEDMATLAASGVGKLFGPGSSTQDIVVYIRDWFAGRFGADALTPLPPAREITPLVPASRTAAEARHHALRGAAAARPAAKRAAPKRSGAAPRTSAGRTSTKPSRRAAAAKSTRRVTPAKPQRRAKPAIATRRTPAARARSRATGRGKKAARRR